MHGKYCCLLCLCYVCMQRNWMQCSTMHNPCCITIYARGRCKCTATCRDSILLTMLCCCEGRILLSGCWCECTPGSGGRRGRGFLWWGEGKAASYPKLMRLRLVLLGMLWRNWRPGSGGSMQHSTGSIPCGCMHVANEPTDRGWQV